MQRLLAAAILGGLALVACGDDDGGGDLAAFCDAVDRIEASGDPFEVADDPVAFQAEISSFRDALDDARANAPSEISDEVDEIASQVDRAYEALSEIEDPTDDAQVEAALAPFDDDDEDEDLSDEVDAFILDECGIDLNEGSR